MLIFWKIRAMTSIPKSEESYPIVVGRNQDYESWVTVDDLEKRLAAGPVTSVPTITM
jgi:hypothetical protein